MKGERMNTDELYEIDYDEPDYPNDCYGCYAPGTEEYDWCEYQDGCAWKGMGMIPAMTKIPAFTKDNSIMQGAFVACVMASVEQDKIVDQFQKDTGIDLSRAFRWRNGIEMMVDKACGYDPRHEAFIKFCDWIAENVWGLDE